MGEAAGSAGHEGRLVPGGWDYERVPNYRDRLVPQIEAVLVDLRTKALDAKPSTEDTRPIHARFFDGLATPSYFAGNYRGAPFPLLKNAPIYFSGKAGAPPDKVEAFMASLSRKITKGIEKLDQLHQATAAKCARRSKIRAIVRHYKPPETL